MRRFVWFAVLAAGLSRAYADTIAITGTIHQSTQDGTGPAANNPQLNSIADGDAYTVFLNLSGPGSPTITTPGLYDLTGASLTFSDPAGPAVEASFGSITLVVSNAGAVDDLTLLGCLTTGTACNQGDSLSASFEIAAASLNALNVPATGLDQPHPLDLLEDDGITDIQGDITRYSYTVTPEPAPALLLIGGFGIMRVAARKRSK